MEDNEKNKLKLIVRKLLNVRGKAFYVALAVCLTCVGGAAYSSINSWNNFNKPKESIEIKAPEKTKKENPLKKEEKAQEAAKPAKPSEQKSNEVKTDPEKKPPEEKKATNTNNAKAKIIYPVSKNIVKPFSGEAPVFSETMSDWRAHNGVDLEAEKNSVVKSITSGKIQSIKTDTLFGKILTVEHSNGVLAQYCGLEEVKVREGQNVTPEQELGTLGTVPSELREKSHLHLTMQKDGKYINPIDILGK